MSELVGRAVEAAARAAYEDDFGPGTWAEAGERGQRTWRESNVAPVLAVLGVVADHCTTEADARVGTVRDGFPEIASHVEGVIAAFRAVAAELRETP